MPDPAGLKLISGSSLVPTPTLIAKKLLTIVGKYSFVDKTSWYISLRN